MQAEGEAAYADVQHAHPTVPQAAAASTDRLQSANAAAMGTPAARLSAAHISTTPPHAAAAAVRTPQPADVTRALLLQSETPVTAAAQLSAQLAVSPSVLTPGVAQAMAEAGEAVAAAAAQGTGQESTANLDKIKAKLAVLKEHIGVKTKRMSDEKRRQIEGQIEKLEKSLAYVEKQRVSRVGAAVAYVHTLGLDQLTVSSSDS